MDTIQDRIHASLGAWFLLSDLIKLYVYILGAIWLTWQVF